MAKLSISVEPRKVLGKKVKKLRAEGQLPTNLFGKDLKSIALQVEQKEFRKVFKEAGETGIVEIKVKDIVHPALIHNVQKDPISGQFIHADFHKVNLKEKITAHVPVKLVGEAQAEKSGVGLVLQTINEVEVESLPGDIPHQIDVDISKLEEVGQAVHIKDLNVEKGKVEIKNNPEEVVVSVQSAEMKEEPVEEAPAPDEVEATKEKPDEEGEAEKEEPKEEKPAEESPDKPQE